MLHKVNVKIREITLIRLVAKCRNLGAQGGGDFLMITMMILC